MAQIVTDPPAQVQSQTAGFLVGSAVAAGIALFKNPGQILRADADARIPNAQGGGFLQLNGYGSPERVFHGVGENLLQHKQQPFFIRGQLEMKGTVV